MRIAIDVARKIATVKDNAKIVCENGDYEVEFAFDDEWDAEGIKTARFSYQRQGKSLYQDQVFTGSICPVPVLYDILEVRIGVYAGGIRTSTPAVVECEKSILCGDPIHDEPPEDVYNQIVELYQQTAESATASAESAKAAEEKAASAEESVKRAEALVGDMDAAFDELHAYAQNLIGGAV